MIRVRIKEPWWGAYIKFGWKKKQWGVGIKADDVKNALYSGENIELEVWKFRNKYILDPEKLNNYTIKYKYFFIAKGTLLYIYPQSMIEGKLKADKIGE